MGIAMDSDGVTFGHNPLHIFTIVITVDAFDKEGGLDPFRFENVKYLRGDVTAWTVVKGQVDGVAIARKLRVLVATA